MTDVADLKAEILALRAENAELRKHVKMPDEPLEIDEKDFYVRAFIKWATEEQPEVKRLESENEKLRELARHLYVCLSFCDREDEERGCGFCPYRSASENCEFGQRLLELGVEVDA